MLVARTPFAWNQAAAYDFPTFWSTLQRVHPAKHPVSYFMIATICFEETGFCNIKQAERPAGLGVGFGQLEVKNPEKVEFYEWAGVETDYRKLSELMIADREFSLGLHCQYFQYLTEVKNLRLDGCLSAQVGTAQKQFPPHSQYPALFKKGASLLESAFEANDRDAYIYALNYARYNSPKKNGTPASLFKDYWEFILPQSWFDYGF